MRKKLGLSQADLARLAGVSQGVISRAEDSDYGNLTFNTVLRIAAGLDVAFVGRLVPFADLARWFDNLSEKSVQVPTFDEEDRGFEGLGTTVDYAGVSRPVTQCVAGGVVFTAGITTGITTLGDLYHLQLPVPTIKGVTKVIMPIASKPALGGAVFTDQMAAGSSEQAAVLNQQAGAAQFQPAA